MIVVPRLPIAGGAGFCGDCRGKGTEGSVGGGKDVWNVGSRSISTLFSGCTEDDPSFSFLDAAIAACKTAAGTATIFFSFDSAIVWELAGPAIDTDIWDVEGDGFTLDVTGIVDEDAALAAAACKRIAVGGGWGVGWRAQFLCQG